MRVFLANAEAEVRAALRLVFSQERDVCVAGEAQGTHGLLERIQAARPDLVFLDWELPGPPVADLIPALRAAPGGASGQPGVIVLSLRPEAEAAALNAGADVFFSKADPPERLLEALRTLVEGCRTRVFGHDGLAGERAARPAPRSI